MSAGRRVGLGGTRAATHEASVQPMLPLHRQFDGRARLKPGSLFAYLSHAPKLQTGVRRISDVAYERDAKFVGGSLPAHASRPNDGLDRRRDAGARRKAFVGA